MDIYQTSIDSSPIQPSTSTNIEKKRKIIDFNGAYDFYTNTKENDEDELSTYLKQPPIIYSNKCDILQWWKENNKDLPIMAQIARDYLSLMPTSVISLRIHQQSHQDRFHLQITPTIRWIPSLR